MDVLAPPSPDTTKFASPQLECRISGINDFLIIISGPKTLRRTFARRLSGPHPIGRLKYDFLDMQA